MKKRGPLVQQEQDLIHRRLAYMERWQGAFQTNKRNKPEDGGVELARSLALLGTLTDVCKCMKEIADDREVLALHGSRSGPRVIFTRGPVKTFALDALSLGD